MATISPCESLYGSTENSPLIVSFPFLAIACASAFVTPNLLNRRSIIPIIVRSFLSAPMNASGPFIGDELSMSRFEVPIHFMRRIIKG